MLRRELRRPWFVCGIAGLGILAFVYFYLMLDYILLQESTKCKNHKPTNITKMIHFVWINLSPEGFISEELKHNIQHCININPNYKVVVWQEGAIQDFLWTYYTWFKFTYDTYKHPIQKIDAVRYFILYHYGGFFLDMDMACIQPFDNIIWNISQTFPHVDFIAAAERKRILTGFSGYFQLMNGFMGTPPKHPLMLEAITNLRSSNRFFLTYRRSALLSAGAWYFARIFDKYPCKEHVFPLNERNFLQGVFMNHAELNSWHTYSGNMVHYLWVITHVTVTMAYIAFLFKLIAHLCNVKIDMYKQTCSQRRYTIIVFLCLSYACSHLLWFAGII